VRARGELSSLRQRRLLLGKPSAPVQIIEYASLDCGACARLHRAVVPALIAQYVRTGIASLEFRSVADTPVSLDLALGAYAASSQRHGWDFIQLAYLRSLPQSATPDSPARLAAALGLDPHRFRRDLRDHEWQILLKGAASVVRVAGFTGDPVFLVHRPGDPFTVLTQPRTIHAFTKAIVAARAGHA
jgi:predicted DsbA family dithiol-disulfide isomerase